MRSYWLAFAIGFLPFAGAAETNTVPAVNMLHFLPSVLELAGDPPREAHLKIICQAHLNPDDREHEGYATVLSVEEKKALIIAFSSHALERPWATMTLRGVFVEAGQPHPTDEGTMDWAYVFDRNQDGKIDFFSYLVGPIWIAPEGDAASSELPGVKGGVQEDFFEENRDKLRMGFWHLADDNFDGDHDGLIARTVNETSGWSDGWAIVSDSDFDTQYDSCTWTEYRLDAASNECLEDENGYQVPGKSIAGLRKLPPPGEFQLKAMNKVVSACNLSADSLYSTPLRPGWPFLQDNANRDSCYDELDYESCHPLALEGDAEAQERLGYMYANGKGVAEDHEEAVEWFRLSADQGYEVAEYNLGYMYFWGRGVPEDHVESGVWTLKAAEQGYALAQVVLSARYQKGDGVPQDAERALFWLRKAAEQGHANSQYILGLRYASGMGVRENYVQAYAWWTLASMHGSAKGRDGIEAISQAMTRKQVAKAKKIAMEIHDRTLQLHDERMQRNP